MKRNYCIGVQMSRISLLLLGLGAAWAAPQTEVAAHQALEDKVHSIEVRQGIDMGISIRSQFSSAEVSSEQDSANLSGMPDRERTEFTQLDLSLLFRPWAATRGEVVLRLHSGHQDFFNAGAKVVSVPWMHMDGRIGDNVFYQAGDFREQYSPLTLFTPGIDILFEPEVFRRQRHMAQSQSYLKGNQRNLQGANLQYRQSFSDLLSEVRVEGLASRLRRIQDLDLAGYTGNLQANEGVMGASQSASTDRWLLAANSELLLVRKSIYTGFTFLDQRDWKSTRTYRLGDSLPINPLGFEHQNQVLSARAGVDVSTLLEQPKLIAQFTGEFAQSSTDYLDTTVNGNAILASLAAGYKMDPTLNTRVTVEYLANDKEFYNPVAQSPSFVARRVLNTDKDRNTIKYGTQSPLYSTFDALYRFNPRFTPMAGAYPLASGVDDLKREGAQSQSYQIAPFEKTSWNTAVLDATEMALIQQYFTDPTIQMSLPFGLATPNRTGVQTKLELDALSANVQMQGVFSKMSEKEASAPLPKADFTEMGGGLLVDAGGLMGWKLPVQASFSQKMGERKQGEQSLETVFRNVGLYFKYHARFGVAAGLQTIDQVWKNAPILNGVAFTEGTQMQWNVGLDYSLSRNLWLSVSYSQADIKNTYQSSLEVDANGKFVVAAGEPAPYQLPTYYHAGSAVAAGTTTTYQHDFQRSILEAMVNVDF